MSQKILNALKKHGFTKMAVSPLILVRFEKFKIWHAQLFNANLLDVTAVARATTSRARRDCYNGDYPESYSELEVWLPCKHVAMDLSLEPRGRF